MHLTMKILITATMVGVTASAWAKALAVSTGATTLNILSRQTGRPIPAAARDKIDENVGKAAVKAIAIFMWTLPMTIGTWVFV
jgi:hypothetical protein